MPKVADVDGVKVQLYSNEHPPPHFHVVFAEHRAQIDLRSLVVLKGSLPPAKLKRILKWAATRHQELRSAWESVQAKQKPERIR